jgi:hypothetical protein
VYANCHVAICAADATAVLPAFLCTAGHTFGLNQ